MYSSLFSDWCKYSHNNPNCMHSMRILYMCGKFCIEFAKILIFFFYLLKYLKKGGLKAVVWTDVVQIFSMFGALILVAVKGTMDLGGADIVFKNAWNTGRIEAPM